MEQSSILSAKFDCPVACQKFLLLASAHDRETGLYPRDVSKRKNENTEVV